jgi:hypothetical protein
LAVEVVFLFVQKLDFLSYAVDVGFFLGDCSGWGGMIDVCLSKDVAQSDKFPPLATACYL